MDSPSNTEFTWTIRTNQIWGRMETGLALVVLLVLSLAWVNGANDVAKGVATLAGSGVAGARPAIIWGTLCTVLGGLMAVLWGAALLTAFAGGYLNDNFDATRVFVAGAVAGAAAWVLVATRLRLPVSTTHALLGGIVGAALASSGSEGLALSAVTHMALAPLLISPLVAIVLCWLLLIVVRRMERRFPAWSPGCCAREDWERNPYVCDPDPGRRAVAPAISPRVLRLWNILHWLSSGATSFARGLSDVPKIAALLLPLFALAPGSAPVWPIVAVALAMGLGSLWGGFRLLPVLAQRVTRMDARTGLIANVGTSALVLAAAPLGLPVSTTHVSTGALMGIRFGDRAPPERADALKLILFGWVITLPVAAMIAAGVCLAGNAWR